ncbi:MAG TPA: exopolysaccharide biosynthesis polyprenyl glycosylphosphotransferase, partial [Chthoniobacterales bacterium]|nr:exopolysaccharide biosynthesis polyprenyl glycosylphosphotransferase [Chthoniobacterales bacterium]
LRQTFASVGVLIFYLIAAKDSFISRIFFFNFLPWLYIALLFSHHFLPEFLARKVFRREERTLLVGSTAKARALRGWLRHKAEMGLRIVGIISDEPDDDSETDIRLLGGFDRFRQVVQENQVTQVVMVEFPQFTETNRNLIATCDQLGVRLLIVSDLEEKLGHPIIHFDDDGVCFVGLREEPLENPINRGIKRTIDFAIALPLMLFLFPPLALLVWFAQRLQSPGPLFHKQTRSGIQNRRFDIWKFRTMHPENTDLARQATSEDERVYPLGRWFRKLSIDEVPQFWNVLRGDMSVVGPRPHLLEHNEQFSRLMANYQVRTFVKPGITGLAQVRGFRGEAQTSRDIQNRIACDIEYLENWNFTLECGIIARTVAQLFLPPPSAY